MSTHPTDACGCCEGIQVLTPETIFNRPALPALDYRAGTHASFKSSMLARLSTELRTLTTRHDDDFSIALIDAWATVADVLTFYQERIANETYLRTAVERRSILELARLIGYELAPGVAAEVALAFTVDTAPGAPQRVLVPVGTRAQSIPGPEEEPQTFETDQALTAYPEWNALQPRQSRAATLRGDARTLFLAGTASNLTAGDWLLLRTLEGGEVHNTPRRIAAVEADTGADRTRVELVGGSDSEPAGGAPDAAPAPQEVDLLLPDGPSTDAETIAAKARELATDFTLSGADVATFAERNRLPETQLAEWINALQLDADGDPGLGVFALRVRTAPFGHNAPLWNTLPLFWRYLTDEAAELILESLAEKNIHPFWLQIILLASIPYPISWDGSSSGWPIHHSSGRLGIYEDGQPYRQIYGAAADREVLLLERAFSDIVPDSWIVLRGGGRQATFRVTEVEEVSRSDFSLSGQVTRVELAAAEDGDLDDVELFALREAAILAQSERLELAPVPLTEPVAGSEIELGQMLEWQLQPGQLVAVSGELAAAEGGVEAREVLEVRDVMSHHGRSTIRFLGSLDNAYRRDSVTLSANLAPASHGETRREVLGSGDAGRPFQRFELQQKPLTWRSAPVPSGVESSLELRVDGVRWQAAPRFFGLGGDERRYVLRRDDEGTTSVLFGDGVNGARLPSGQENVTARYRTGIGSGGLVAAGQISTLLTRPLGVQEVSNPLAPRGAEDPETLGQARRNAPCTVLTLERIVSLADFEDFARCFPGLAKAHATWVWDGEQKVVLLTVAGVDGAAVEGNLLGNLRAAMDAARDPHQMVKVASYQALTFDLTARLHVHPDHQPETVLQAAEEALRQAFAFDRRNFAQSVARSEVYALLQGIAGVEALDLDALHRSGRLPSLAERLIALPARFRSGRLVPAQLLTLGSGIQLEAI